MKRFGSTATSPTLTLGGSYATRTFKVNPAGLDAGKMIDLPDVAYIPPRAGYLAWLDFNALALGPDPAQRLLERGGIALSSGPTFGVEGRGFARLNIGTTRALLEQAVTQMAAAVRK